MPIPEVASLRKSDLNRLTRLRDLRADVDRRIDALERRLEAYDLIERTTEEEGRVPLDQVDAGEPPSASTRRGPGQSEQRFGRRLLNFARGLILEHGPQSIEALIAAMPADLVRDVENLGQKYPAEFRVRRAFRRSLDFHVDRRMSTVTYVGHLEERELPVVTRLIVENDAVTAVVVTSVGGEETLTIQRFNDEVHGRRLFAVRGPDRLSAVVPVDGLFRSMYRGEFNDDMRNVPRERRKGAPL